MDKGMGIRMMGSVILALVGVSILLGVFSSNFGSGGGGVFCTTYNSVSGVFPGKEAPSAEGCGQGSDVDYESIRSPSRDEFSLKLSSAVISCYDEHKGYNVTDEFCEGWNVKELPGTVNESDLTAKIDANSLCGGTSISNNACEYSSCSGCGSENQIYFQRQNISEGDFIVISYNVSSGTERVEIR